MQKLRMKVRKAQKREGNVTRFFFRHQLVLHFALSRVLEYNHTLKNFIIQKLGKHLNYLLDWILEYFLIFFALFGSFHIL